MNFYYHPVLGLQYSSSDYFIMEVNLLPKIEMSIEKAIEILNKTGIIFSDSSIKSVEVKNCITSNHLELSEFII